KHAIYLVAEGAESDSLFDLLGLGFSSKKKELDRPIVPAVKIDVNGKSIDLPKTPVRSTNQNGIVGYNNYEATYTIPSGETGIPVVSASASNPAVKVSVNQATTASGSALVTFDYNGVLKMYKVVFASK